MSPQADGPPPRLSTRVGDVLVAQEVAKKDVGEMRGSGRERERERVRRPQPNLLVRDGEVLHVQLLAPSIPRFAGRRPAALQIHVPAHALVQAGVHLGQVRRRPAVHEGGQPQPPHVAPADGEVRNAGETGDGCQSDSRREGERE